MRQILLVMGILLLGACGRGDGNTPPATTASVPTATMAPTTIPTPTATPAPTVVVALDIAPTVANAPLVVSPVVTRTIELLAGGQVLLVELASTPEQRQVGLMYRQQMDEHAGMLFVFPGDESLAFWMRNTALPLSIAFVGADKVILNIEDMQPFDDQTLHYSQGPARYALEVNQGWFARNGVVAGDRLEFTLPDDLDIR